MVGFVGTTLHVAAWALAIVFDIALATQIDSDKAPGAFTFWLWGFITMLVGFVVLVSVTVWHAFSSDENKIPEGGAPPFMMYTPPLLNVLLYDHLHAPVCIL